MEISKRLIKQLKNTNIHVYFFLGVIFGEQKSPCGSVSPKHRILEKKERSKKLVFFRTDVIWLKTKKCFLTKVARI